MFQPTRPRRARHARRHRDVAELCFNPRAHEGRDMESPPPPACPPRFQPTRPRRARQGYSGLTKICALFQPTRPRRARHLAIGSHQVIVGFNPRAHEGRDPTGCNSRFGRGSFNPRAHEGRDGLRAALIGDGDFVSTHAPTKGATSKCSSYPFNPAFQPTRPRRARPSPASLITRPR